MSPPQAPPQPPAPPPPPSPPALGGVMITPEGLLQPRVPAAPAKRPGNPNLTYISLARVIDQLQQNAAAPNPKPLPKELRYLQGLTRIDYLFVFPDQHD